MIPEKLARLLPWAEPLATGLAALWLGWIGAGHAAAGNVFALLPLLGAAAAGTWAWASARRLRLRLRQAGLGPGLVQIEEGRVIYFGPETGGVAALDLLSAILVVADAEGGVARWVLEDERGGRLEIPGGALRAERLPDLFGALPGFAPDAVLRALATARAEGRAAPVWRRPATGPRIVRG
ncbi:hypothetical protein LNKW23_39130 [Paralimibaculum aggregatum]|uniref:Uncharacterized protein n=1 Tax=Paralimibaculum aggregatum TaxID=3036245 RepID=A0ABQ6LR27_9RHOB|nr:hypothetical protein [Limibaculum sp. NKW23]GMG84697.1 hypothetical protein LNKW23_39130 [Limibaculum sp. NKW23]